MSNKNPHQSKQRGIFKPQTVNYRIAPSLSNKNLFIQASKLNWLGHIRGLMFRSSKSENLLFNISSDKNPVLHSWFVFFPFLVLWLNDKNRVVEWKKVYPFSMGIKSSKKFSKFVEIPCNNKNKKLVRYFVERGKI